MYAQKGDMANGLYPQFIDFDLVVLSTPLYHFTVNAIVKAFIKQTLPINPERH